MDVKILCYKKISIASIELSVNGVILKWTMKTVEILGEVSKVAKIGHLPLAMFCTHIMNLNAP